MATDAKSFIFFFAFLFNLFVLTIFSGQVFARESEGLRKVYLATYPRSGNHWMRYLIEEASHIATGSVYCDPDPPHLQEPFSFGAYCCDHGYRGHCRYPNSDDAVVIKTHFPCHAATPFDLQPSAKIIHLVRHPVDAIYSYYVYQHKLGTGRPPTTRMSQERLRDYIASWRHFQDYWSKRDNVLLLRYEDLFKHPLSNLKKILKAIGYRVDKIDLQRAVIICPPQGRVLKHLHRYSREDLQLMDHELKDLLKRYGYKIPLK